jgi:multiple sugar transport system substrate-binding protein
LTIKSVPTLETVALRAGVSRQTVSNALHRPERLATATRDRVLVAVRETGYRPSLPARQLATRRSHAVAVRADLPQDGISGLVLDAFFHGLAEAGQRSGHRVVLYAAQDDQTTELAVLEDLLGSAAADAVVLTGTDRDDERPAGLTAAGLTFCSFGRPWADGEPPHDWVDVDGALGTALAVEHLLATGHRRIAFLGWPEQSPTGEDRRAGWLQAVRAAGDAGSVVEGRSDNDARAAQAAVEQMLTSADPPDAVVCASDTLAFGAHRAGPGAGPTAGHRGLRRDALSPRPSASPASRSPSARPPTPAWTCCCRGCAGSRRLPAASCCPPGCSCRPPDPARPHVHPHVHPTHVGVTRWHTRPDAAAGSRKALAVLAALSLSTVAACGGSSFDEGSEEPAGEASAASGPAELQILIASSGDAETEAVKAAAAAWAEESGNEVEVLPATDITQQLSQGFAGGKPPDLFYVDAGAFADYAVAGNLYPYADQIEDVDDFYQPLRDTFTLDGTEYCVPKDFSTLALEINDASWQAAGLTDEDIPTTWEELATVAEKLTTPEQAGLVIGTGRDRAGAFLVQNGGFWVSEEGEVTATDEKNVEALTFVKELLASGSAVLPPQVDSGWGGEAFGTGRAAMTMEGNWIRGAMKNDYPDVKYTVAELPEGPAGKGTLSFTQCWGIAAESPNQAAAVELVEYLTTPEQQLEFAEAFGVMPSRQAAREDYIAAFPDDAPFIAGGEYGRGPVTLPGLAPALSDLDSQLEQLGSSEPKAILESFQTNAEAALPE